MTKKILFLNPYPDNVAPSQRLKYEQYYQFIEEDGWHIDKKSFINHHFWSFIYKPGNTFAKIYQTIIAYFKRLFTILFLVPKYDVVYVHLWVTPLGLPFYEWLTILRAKKVIYDIDDLIFIGHVSKANRIWLSLKGRKKMTYLMRKSHHVITCTPKLDTFVRKYNENTTDISSTVDTIIRYQAKQKYEIDDIPILGWSGSVTTSKYLYLLTEPLQNLAKKYKFKLYVLGDKTFNIEGVQVEAKDWTESIEMKTLNSFDIGLYPLPDEEWVHGKSGLKAIQYMALGIPTIATGIGANFRVIEDKVSGLLVPPNDSKSWEQAIENLLNDKTLREKLGKNARERVEEKFSLTANKKIYLDIINS